MEIVEGTATVADVASFVEKIETIAGKHDLTIQAFDARYVADRPHLRRAVDLAARAIERGEKIADDRGVEILLYAAGRRQINRALEMGVSTGTSPIAVVVDCERHDWSGDPSGEKARQKTDAERLAASEIEGLLDPAEALDTTSGDGTNQERLRSYFDITDQERDATDGTVSDLVRERVALLVVER